MRKRLADCSKGALLSPCNPLINLRIWQIRQAQSTESGPPGEILYAILPIYRKNRQPGPWKVAQYALLTRIDPGMQIVLTLPVFGRAGCDNQPVRQLAGAQHGRKCERARQTERGKRQAQRSAFDMDCETAGFGGLCGIGLT